MVRVLATLSILVLLACGGQEAGEIGGPEALPPVSAPAEATPTPEVPAPSVTADLQVASCLDLIGQGRFAEALPACLAALEVAPDNEEVRAAVERARSETAKIAEAGGAVEGAASEAAARAEEATEGLSEQMGR